MDGILQWVVAFCCFLSCTKGTGVGEASVGTCKDGECQDAGLALLARRAKLHRGLPAVGDEEEDDGVEFNPLQALISQENEAGAREYFQGEIALPEGLAIPTETAERERTLELISSYVQDRANTTIPVDRDWSRSFSAGYADAAGKYIGGSEIVHLAAYGGKLYACNGYWMDSRSGKSAAQVLRLDSPTDMWQQDLDTMMDAQLSNAPGAHFSYCLRVTALKELHVVTDSAGKKVDKKILIAACSAYLDMSGTTGVAIFVKTSAAGAWKNSFTLVSRTSARKTPRDAEAYVDKVTGVQRIFLLVGDFGVQSGTYNSAKDDIDWDAAPEKSAHGTFPVRALGLAETQDGLFFSVGRDLWLRSDGASPSWSKATEVPEATQVNTEVGGVRGLSAVDGGQDMLLVWSPDGSSKGDIYKVTHSSMAPHSETSLRALYDDYAPSGGGSASYSLGGYNSFYPITDPKTKSVYYILGFQQVVKSADPAMTWNGFFAGAAYAVRKSATDYHVAEVGGPYTPGKPALVGARTFALSPFPGEEGVLYVAGFDANFKSATNTAWIFKAGLNKVLGNPPVATTTTATTTQASTCGVCTGTSGILDAKRVAGSAHGFQYTCQDAEDFVKRNAARSGCHVPDPSWPTTCCRGCNLCPKADSRFTPSAAAGNSGGKPFTCQDFWNYMQSPSAAFPCAVAQAHFGPKCCAPR